MTELEVNLSCLGTVLVSRPCRSYALLWDNPVRFAVLINSKRTWAVSDNGGLYRNSPNFREKGKKLTLILSFSHFDRKFNPKEGIETNKHRIFGRSE